MICFCYNTMLLKQSDKHLQANINHFAYSMNHFSDVLERTGLKADFDYALAYLQSLRN